MLSTETRGGPRFFVLDNPDPEKVAATLGTVDLRNTLVNVVTKSGQTAETMANFLVVQQALEAAVGREQATPADRGDHRSQRGTAAEAGGPGGVPHLSGTARRRWPDDGAQRRRHASGGHVRLRHRWIFWPVRAPCDARSATADVRQNPAYLLAAICILADTRLGKSILVTMPYADALFGLADWFRQLWAESLGKRLSLDGRGVFAGQTPIKALGAIDQHSQMQLYTEGPNDKLHSLIAVEQYRAEVTIEDVPPGTPELDYLQGAELGQLLQREATGDGLGAHPGQTPKLHHYHPTIDAAILGEFFYLYELQTVMAGALLNVNPFGQPGVEAGKNATYALMGRKGYETLRDELELEWQREAYRFAPS